MNFVQFGGGLCVFCGKMKDRCTCKQPLVVIPMSQATREKVDACTEQMTEMGFDPVQARRAAELNGGNVDQASNFILNHLTSSSSSSRVQRLRSPPRSPTRASQSGQRTLSIPNLHSAMPPPPAIAPIRPRVYSTLPPSYTSTSHPYTAASNASSPPVLPRSSLSSLPSVPSRPVPSPVVTPSPPVTKPAAESATSSSSSSLLSSTLSSSSPPKPRTRPSFEFTAPDVFSRISPPSIEPVESDDRNVALMSLDGQEEDAHGQLVMRQGATGYDDQPGGSWQDPRSIRDLLTDEVSSDTVMRSLFQPFCPPLPRRVISPPASRGPRPTPPSILISPLRSSPHKSPKAEVPYPELPPPDSPHTLSAYDQFCRLALWLHPHEFRPPVHVDCQDSMGKWLRATLLHLHTDFQPQSPHLTTFCHTRARYDGWAARWDEDIDILRAPHRLARLHQHSQPSLGWKQPGWAHAGNRVIAWWSKGKSERKGFWVNGEVLKVDLHQVHVRCAVPGFDQRNRWFSTDSDCILGYDDYVADQLMRQLDEERTVQEAQATAAVARAYKQQMEAEAQHMRRPQQQQPLLSSFTYAEPLAAASLSDRDRHVSLSSSTQVKKEAEAASTSLSSLSRSPSLSMSNTPVQRRSPSLSMTPPPTATSSASGECPYWVGQFLEVQDTVDKWLPAELIAVSPSRQALLIHYEGWDSRWDEWLPFFSPRIRALGSTLQDSAEERRRKRQEAAFRSLLSSLPYTLVEEEKDGNCLFRAVARQLWGDPVLHRRVRTQCCDWIEKEGDYFRAFLSQPVEDYVKLKRKADEWGDHLEIEGIKELYDINVLVYDKQQTDAKAEDDADEHMRIDVKGELLEGVSRTVRLSYHGRNHYNSLIDPLHPSPLLTGDVDLGAGRWKATRVQRERRARMNGVKMEEEEEQKGEKRPGGEQDIDIAKGQKILLGQAQYR